MTWQPKLGAIVEGAQTRFRAWAPRAESLELVLEREGRQTTIPMARADGGYREATFAAPPGTRYGYLVDGQGPFPDPCSRSQPAGVHALSEVVDPAVFAWTDAGWKRPAFRDLVIYECHIGTFSEAGTFEGASERLAHLKDLGINALEVMPIAAFPGRWGWGYDGVSLFAPFQGYGGPGGFRRLVDAAHAAGIAVILDVVYNHFGPDGNYVGQYSDDYFTAKYQTPWGSAVNFDGPGSEAVRSFFRENLLHWAYEYHIDGFRFDATHAIFDASPVHVLAELSGALQADGPRGHGAAHYLVAESHENDVRYVTSREDGGFGFDAVWADDFHHGVRTILLHEHEGYLRSYDGSARQLARTVCQGFLYEGQWDPGANDRRGTKARECAWTSFVYCIQNHDQIGNQPFGERLTIGASRAAARAAQMLLLLLPQTPLLFQGQEWLSTTPFLYFSDHEPALGKLVTEGRRREFAGFRAFNDPETRHLIPDPQADSTFLRSVLTHEELERGPAELAQRLVRRAIAVRKRDKVLGAYRKARHALETRGTGACLVVAFEAPEGRRRLVCNFGPATSVDLGADAAWQVALSSSDAAFGGHGQSAAFSGSRLAVPPETCLWITETTAGAPARAARRPNVR